MKCGKLFIFVAFGTSALFLLAAASAQQARFFPDFNPATSPVGSLKLNGSQLTAYNDFQTNRAIDFEVVGLVHSTHATHAKQLLNLIAATQHGADFEQGCANSGKDLVGNARAGIASPTDFSDGRIVGGIALRYG